MTLKFVAGTRPGQLLNKDLNTADRRMGMLAQPGFYGDHA